MSCLYIFEINCQLLRLLLFFPILRESFHLAYSLLCCEIAFKFNQVPLVYFWFCFHYSRRWVIEDLALIFVIECSAYVSSKSFIVSDLPFRSLIHLEFIFVYDVKNCSNFILLQVAVQFS